MSTTNLRQSARKFVIALDIQTLSPMTISSGETGRYDPDTGRIHRSGKMGVECSLTHKLALASKAMMVSEKDEKTGQASNEYLSVPRVPVITSGTLTGRLRRAASDLIFESLAARGLMITVDAANTLMTGSPTTNIVQPGKVEVIQMGRKDPFLGLFGGTSFMLSSGCVFSTGWPIIGHTLDLLMTQPLHQENIQVFERLSDMTSPEKIIRKNDVRDMRGARLQEVVGNDNLAAYVEKEGQDQVDAKQNKVDDQDGKKVNIRSFNAVEVINTGMNFALRVQVTARSDAHLGLMLLSFQKMLRLGQIGGREARGCGMFVCSEGNSRLFERDPQTSVLTPLGSIFKDRASGYPFVDDDFIGQAVAAGQDYLDEVSPALINAFASCDEKTIVSMARACEELV